MPFNNPIIDGSGALVREAIMSPNYVQHAAGWTINADGSAEFNDVEIRGSLDVDGEVRLSGTNVLIVEDALEAPGAFIIISPSAGTSGSAPLNAGINFYGWNHSTHTIDSWARIRGDSNLLSLIFRDLSGPTQVVDSGLSFQTQPGLNGGTANAALTTGAYIAGSLNDAIINMRSRSGDGVVDSRIQLEANTVEFSNGIRGLGGRAQTVSNTNTTPISINSATFGAYAPNDCGTTFVGPNSGKVMIHYSIRVTSAAAGQRTYCAPEVRTGGILGSGTVIYAAADDDSVHDTTAASGYIWEIGNHLYLDGLTPGSTYNVQLQMRTTAAGTPATGGRRRVTVQPQIG